MSRKTYKRAAAAILATVLLYFSLARALTPATDASQTVTVGYLPSSIAVDEFTQRVVVANYGGGDPPFTPVVSILDAMSGTVQKTVAVNKFPYALALDGRHHRAIVAIGGVKGRVPSSLIGIDTRTGTTVWQTIVPVPPLVMSLDRATGLAFLGVALNAPLPGGRIEIIDTATGRLRGRIALSLTPKAEAIDEQRRLLFVVGTAHNQMGRLLILDTRTNSVKETVAAGVEPSAVAVDVRHHRIVVLNIGGVSATCVLPGASSCRFGSSASIFDERDGRRLQTVSVGPNPLQVVVDEQAQRAFVVSEGDGQGGPGSLSVLDEQSGRLVQTATLGPNPAAIAVDPRRMRAFVADNDKIDVFATRNGRLIRTLAVAATAGALAVDEATGRTFVASSNSADNPTPAYATKDTSFLGHILAGIGTTTGQLRALRGKQLGVVSIFDNVNVASATQP